MQSHHALIAIVVLTACGGSTEDPAWMARFDDNRSLTALSIPGTHDSGAHEEPYPGLAKCQDLTIAQQLAAGVRYFDLRCRHFNDTFLIYHGAIDQEQTFDDVLATLYAFLDAHPSETIIASVKEEAVSSGTTRSFEATFADYQSRSPEHWLLGASIPRLGDARGKLVLLRRFAATAAPLGIDATVWADSATFTIEDADARLRVQDEYVVASNDAKWAAIDALLTEARTDTSPATLFLDYTSGYQTMNALPNITSVSDDINVRLDASLAAIVGPAHLGILVMDHVTAARVRAVIATNP